MEGEKGRWEVQFTNFRQTDRKRVCISAAGSHLPEMDGILQHRKERLAVSITVERFGGSQEHSPDLQFSFAVD